MGLDPTLQTLFCSGQEEPNLTSTANSVPSSVTSLGSVRTDAELALSVTTLVSLIL